MPKWIANMSSELLFVDTLLSPRVLLAGNSSKSQTPEYLKLNLN